MTTKVEFVVWMHDIYDHTEELFRSADRMEALDAFQDVVNQGPGETDAMVELERVVLDENLDYVDYDTLTEKVWVDLDG